MGRGAATDDMAALPTSEAAMVPSTTPATHTAPPNTPFMSDLARVQRKWQMASIAHFFESFKDALPLEELTPETYEDLTPSLLERAIAQPDTDTAACVALRDVVLCLLVAIGTVSRKSGERSWFQSLRVLVTSRSPTFVDCYVDGENVLASFDNGMGFLASVSWNIRLGLLLSLCDLAAEEAQSVRDAIRESELATTTGRSEIDVRGYRLVPLGRCTQRRFHYKVGKTRIYSGYKRKGSGALLIECSDSATMSQLADALDSSPHVRDKKLAADIRGRYLEPLIELEERAKKKLNRKRSAEVLKEEARRRNADRPRRSKATYL